MLDECDPDSNPNWWKEYPILEGLGETELEAFKDVKFKYMLHKNPKLREVVNRLKSVGPTSPSKTYMDYLAEKSKDD